MTHDLALSIVGLGGDGAVAAGDILSFAAARDGLSPSSRPRRTGRRSGGGGEASCTVRISAAPIHAQADAVDALVVFSWADFARFKAEVELAPDAVVFHDEKDTPPEGMQAFRLIPIAFAAQRNAKNVFALGLLAATFGLPAEAIRDAVRGRFAKKTEAVIEANVKAFDAGLASGVESPKKLDYVVSEPKLLMSGNDKAALRGAAPRREELLRAFL
jgi:2-oxoglutarate ferredoxin oxidoreductase subunit alpha